MRNVSLVGLMLAGALFAQNATAQTTPPATDAGGTDAAAHYQRALELYQEQDFAGALVEFRRAYELNPSYKMQYNIGQVCYQLNDYACALRSFEQYLKEGGGSVSTERKTEVDKELSKLRLRVGKLEIVTNIAGVEVSVDDVGVGTTPLSTSVVVSTGKRRISGTHAGYAPVSRIVEVAGSDSSRVELVFTNADGSANAAAAPQYESRFNTLTWIGLGATAAFAGATAVTGLVSLNADNDLKDMRYTQGTGPSQDMKDTQDRAKLFAVVSDVFLGASIVTLAGTLVYTFVHKPKLVEKTPPPAAKLDFRFTGTGAALGGTF